MRHDPQRTAAAYLGGQLPRRHRDRFEAHLLACEACWREVQAGRRGRALAEAAREVAPQHLRERVRATIEATPLSPPRWRPRRWVAVTALAVAADLGGGLLDRLEQQADVFVSALDAGERTSRHLSPSLPWLESLTSGVERRPR